MVNDIHTLMAGTSMGRSARTSHIQQWNSHQEQLGSLLPKDALTCRQEGRGSNHQSFTNWTTCSPSWTTAADEIR